MEELNARMRAAAERYRLVERARRRLLRAEIALEWGDGGENLPAPLARFATFVAARSEADLVGFGLGAEVDAIRAAARHHALSMRPEALG